MQPFDTLLSIVLYDVLKKDEMKRKIDYMVVIIIESKMDYPFFFLLHNSKSNKVEKSIFCPFDSFIHLCKIKKNMK